MQLRHEFVGIYNSFTLTFQIKWYNSLVTVITKTCQISNKIRIFCVNWRVIIIAFKLLEMQRALNFMQVKVNECNF